MRVTPANSKISKIFVPLIVLYPYACSTHLHVLNLPTNPALSLPACAMATPYCIAQLAHITSTCACELLWVAMCNDFGYLHKRGQEPSLCLTLLKFVSLSVDGSRVDQGVRNMCLFLEHGVRRYHPTGLNQ